MTGPPSLKEIREWATDDSPGPLDDLYEKYGIEKVKTVHRAPELDYEPQDVYEGDEE